MDKAVADSDTAVPDKAHGNADRRNTVRFRIRRYSIDYFDIAEEVLAIVAVDSLAEVFAAVVAADNLAAVFAEVFENVSELVFEAVLQAERFAAVQNVV